MGKFSEILQQQAGGLIGQAGSGLMGMALAGFNDKRQIKQQQKLIDMQTAADMRMTDFNYAKQLQMWKDTNYSAQIEQMKEAGVNPALLYGMSGGGGTTTGSGAGASIHAPSAPSGGGEIMGMMQLRAQEAQIELMKAQAEKTNVEAKKIEGVDTAKTEAETKSLTQGIENQKAQEKLTQIQTKLSRMDLWIKEDTYDEIVGQIVTTYEQSKVMLSNLKMERDINSTTYQDKITIIQQQAIEGMLKNELIEEEIRNKKVDRQVAYQNIEKMKAEISKMAYDIANKARELTIQEGHLDVEKLKANIQDQNQPIMNVLGGVVRQMGKKFIWGLETILKK